MDPENPANPNGQPPESTPAPAPQAPAEEDKAARARKAAKEEMATRLRASVRRQRPWTFVTCPLLVVLLAAPVVLLAWWLWPKGEPPVLAVTAFDQVGESGAKVVCRARLETLEPARADFDLGGHELVFDESRPEGRGAQKVTTQAGGVAGVDRTVPQGVPQSAFPVGYLTPERRSEARDQARLFGWPRATKVLLVDVAALVPAGAKIWEKETDLGLALQPGAAAALQSAKAAKFAVAYLATEPARALTYQQVRNWVGREVGQRSAPGRLGIPDGPVLGRLSVGGEPSAADWPKAVVAHFKRFDGPLVVLTGDPQTAEAYLAAGARALVVGQGDRGWGDVAKKLAK
jgi:hypothetical protein